MKLRFLVSAVVLFVLITVIGGKTEGFVENFALGLVTGGLVGALVAGGFFFVFWKKIINF